LIAFFSRPRTSLLGASNYFIYMFPPFPNFCEPFFVSDPLFFPNRHRLISNYALHFLRRFFLLVPPCFEIDSVCDSFTNREKAFSSSLPGNTYFPRFSGFFLLDEGPPPPFLDLGLPSPRNTRKRKAIQSDCLVFSPLAKLLIDSLFWHFKRLQAFPLIFFLF